MHGHSLAWLAALVIAVGVMYRRLSVTAWAGGLAGLAYAIDDVHSFATGWLANRNVLAATVFAALALLAHDRWRRHAWRPGAALAPACLLAALLSSEAAGATAAFCSPTRCASTPVMPVGECVGCFPARRCSRSGW